MEEVLLQTQWGWQIALYLFFGGLAGGTLLVAGIVDCRHGEELKPTVSISAWIAVVLLIVGVSLLATETLMPLRAVLLWRSFSHFGSWMTIGAWLLVLAVIAAILYAASVTGGFTARMAWLGKAHRVFRAFAMVLGTCVALYTGILLYVLVAHPLWNTLLIPALFTVSAIDTGVALVMLILVCRNRDAGAGHEVVHKLEVTAVVLIVLEVLVLAALLATVSVGSVTGEKSVALIVNGTLAVAFWLGVVVCGLAVPFGIDLFSVAKNRPGVSVALPVISATACLIGGCVLRFVILMAGLPVFA